LRSILLAFLLVSTILVPSGSATIERVGFGPDAASIPVPYNVTFIAGWSTLDGQTQVGGATVFFAVFGDSAARTTETDVLAQATFAYNVTNLRVVSGPATGGNVNVGESFTITFRVNQVNTALTGTCVGGAAANSFTLDTDVVPIVAGDRLSYSIALAGTVLTRNPRLGITLEGYLTQTTITEEVNEMTPFEELVGLTAWELATLVVLVVLGLMVNARGRDFGSKSAGAILLLVVGLVGLTIRNLWVGGIEFAIFVLLLSGYAFVRAAIDFVEERRAKPKKTDPGAI
jgi:hypothetical protein